MDAARVMVRPSHAQVRAQLHFGATLCTLRLPLPPSLSFSFSLSLVPATDASYLPRFASGLRGSSHRMQIQPRTLPLSLAEFAHLVTW